MPKNTDEIKVLFPEKEVKLSDGSVVIVSPLSLAKLPKVAESFGRLMALAEKGSAPSEIAASALAELLVLIPYCIDRDPEKIPAAEVPSILEVVVEQNVTSDIVGKWMALVEKIQKAGGVNLSSVGRSKTSPK